MFAEYPQRPLKVSTEWAIITDATSDLGYALARCCAQAGYQLLIVANDCRIHRTAIKFMSLGIKVEALETDLALPAGRTQLQSTAANKQVAFAFLGERLQLEGPLVNQNSSGARWPVETVYCIPEACPNDAASQVVHPDSAKLAKQIFHMARYGRPPLPYSIHQRVCGTITAIKKMFRIHSFHHDRLNSEMQRTSSR